MARIQEMTAAAIAQMGNVTPERATDLMRGWEELSRHAEVREKFLMQCDVTGDCRWFFITTSDSPKQIVERYLRFMPEEAKSFMEGFKDYKAVLDDPNGMTGARLAKLLTQMPTKLHFALKTFDPHFFDELKNIKHLIQDFTALEAKR